MQVEIFVSGRKLKNLDVMSKSDPQCKVYEMIDNRWILRGQTETIKDNLNPDFTTKISLPYYFEKTQQLKFEMLDIDSPTSYEEIGVVQTSLGQIMGAKAQIYHA